jgi:hypothetical protein
MYPEISSSEAFTVEHSVEVGGVHLHPVLNELEYGILFKGCLHDPLLDGFV